MDFDNITNKDFLNFAILVIVNFLNFMTDNLVNNLVDFIEYCQVIDNLITMDPDITMDIDQYFNLIQK